MNFRMLGPVAAYAQTVNGRLYKGQPGQASDVIDTDADILRHSGWTFVAISGPTGTRPTISYAQPHQYVAGPGMRFFDTSLNQIVIFDGKSWRDPATGGVV
jgi:hypothetical protein